jgi:hypothetical protein
MRRHGWRPLEGAGGRRAPSAGHRSSTGTPHHPAEQGTRVARRRRRDEPGDRSRPSLSLGEEWRSPYQHLRLRLEPAHPHSQLTQLLERLRGKPLAVAATVRASRTQLRGLPEQGPDPVRPPGSSEPDAPPSHRRAAELLPIRRPILARTPSLKRPVPAARVRRSGVAREPRARSGRPARRRAT